MDSKLCDMLIYSPAENCILVIEFYYAINLILNYLNYINYIKLLSNQSMYY